MFIVIEQCSMRDPWMIGQLFQIYNNFNSDTWQSRWWKYWTTKYRREKRIKQKSDLVISTFKHVSKSPLYCLAWRFSFREWPMLSFLLFHLSNNRIICAQYTLLIVYEPLITKLLQWLREIWNLRNKLKNRIVFLNNKVWHSKCQIDSLSHASLWVGGSFWAK